MVTGKDMEESKRRNESVQQGLQDPPYATEPPDVRAPAGLGVNLTANTLGNQIKGELIMSNRQEAQDYKITTNCRLDADIKETLLKHLNEHGPVSLLTSAKFGQYAGCFLEEIERAIVAESALRASAAADDSAEKQEAPPTPVDEATESPAAMRTRLQSRRIATSSRQRRI